MTTEYICKECGGRVQQICYTTYPASYELKCEKCGRIIKKWQETIKKVEI